jgi:hypothetical protein
VVNTTLGDELMWLADRVATNRERAGLHYRSDSVAGRMIALNIRNKLMEGPDADSAYKKFRKILRAAKDEADATVDSTPASQWW